MKINLNLVIQSVLIAAIIIFFTGCVTAPQPVQRKAVFDENEYAPYNLSGTSIITGQAFLKTRGGDVKFAAGNVVDLNPVTSYSSEWYLLNCVNEQLLISAADPRCAKYHLQTIADGNGNFRFSNLPAGEYYLKCGISWEIPTQYGLERSGGIAHARVKVAAGEEVKVVLTR